MHLYKAIRAEKGQKKKREYHKWKANIVNSADPDKVIYSSLADSKKILAHPVGPTMLLEVCPNRLLDG